MTLNLSQLKVSYGAVSALLGASIRVGAGEVVALIGANGAGKSSLLKALMGLVPHQAESLELGGVDLLKQSTRQRIDAGFALSPEGRCVFPELTAAENLELGYVGSDKAEAAGRVARMFDLFPRLAERRTQAAGTMSGGEQQMLAIARAMMSGPKLLMLDEPTLGLAPIVVQQIGRFIAEISGQGISVIVAEQNAEMALAAADRAYVLENGEIVLAGTAKDLARDPAVQKAFLGV
jgi:branched-chain amino acid transport system ATP-binding protein